jgi:hypothetical protein
VKLLLVAEKLAEVFSSKLLDRNQSTGEMITPPQQLLQFTVKAIQAFGDDGPHKNVGFANGLIFDILNMVNSQNREVGNQKKLATFLEEIFNQGVEIARAALILGKIRKRLVLEKHIISLVMLNQASHAAMALVHEDYLDYLLKLKKAEIPISLQNLAVYRKFHGLHTEFSGVMAWVFKIFDGLAPALRYCESPYLLSAKDEIHLFDISAISYLASHLFLNQSQFKAAQALRAREVRPELSSFDLSFDPSSLFQKKGG